MHPTADTTAFIFLQRCGAAGDARRSAALIADAKSESYAGLLLTKE
jgi:hypothetical protein